MTAEEEERKQRRKFAKAIVEIELTNYGELTIDSWMKTAGIMEESYIFPLDQPARDEIIAIGKEYFAARELEEAEREKRRLAEEQADELMGTHYADRILKIVISQMNPKWIPKPKMPPKKPRRKSY